jgi:hypothetical protein
MVLEFINVHTSGLIATIMTTEADVTKKVTRIGGFCLFATLFAGGLAIAFGTWWPLMAFWLLTVNRLLPTLLGQGSPGREHELVTMAWVSGFVAFVLAGVLTTIVPVPELGITKAVVQAEHLPGEGTWVNEPQRVMAAGVLYFSAVALMQLNSYAWLMKLRDRGATA